MNNDNFQFNVKGHVLIRDDLNNVILDKDNAIHPQNLSRIFSRALANEGDSSIFRIAFGNGGTDVNVANVVTYRTPNDGQPPDTFTWDSRLYNETFSKIIDATQPDFGADPGSADVNTGTRQGGGAIPYVPGSFVPHVSGPGLFSQELGLTSQVIIKCILQAGEPFGQRASDTAITTQNENESFIFDELGLYTKGADAISSSGYQFVNVGNRTVADLSGLQQSGNYYFYVSIDGGTQVLIQVSMPAVGTGTAGAITYGDLCQAVNTSGPGSTSLLPNSALMTITNYDDVSYSSVPPGTQTFGYLTVQSSTAGSSSAVALSATGTPAPSPGYVSLLDTTSPVLNPSGGGPVLLTPVQGSAAGIQNNPVDPAVERERLLAHLIFSPVEKAQNRVFTITYTLTISVARTPLAT